MTFPYSNESRTIAAEFCKIELSIFQGLGDVTEPGGAISADSVVFLSVKYCLFENDIAEMGAGIYASSCGLRLYSSCFSSCRGSRIDYSDGGNAVTVKFSTFSAELTSADLCAPQMEPSGDGVFNAESSNISVINMNSSRCLGKNGECCIGETRGSSVVKYVNAVLGHQYALIMTRIGKIMKSNFINNQLDAYFTYTTGQMIFEDCTFFGNNNDKKDFQSVSYKNCVGDITRQGINPSSITETHQITQVEFSKCLFHLCDQMSRNSREVQLKIPLSSIFWMGLPSFC